MNEIASNKAQQLFLSVVIPSYERAEQTARLLDQLAAQTLPPDRFEVLVVDDGSRKDPRPILLAKARPYRLVVERQENRGPAAARHRGAELAGGDVIVFLDDDIDPDPHLLEEHLEAHEATPRAVVLGCIRSSHKLDRLPLFERFHANKLDDFYASLRATGRAPLGRELCAANFSLRRADYFAVGGFSPGLLRSEDLELGLRLEEAGVKFLFCDAACAVHDSDHGDLAGWLRRAFNYGRSDQQIARMHPDNPDADPWHYLDLVSVLPRPAYALSVAAPALGHAAVRAVMGLAQGLDALGLERPALGATMLCYGMEYYRGVRAEEGSAAQCLRAFRRYRRGKHARSRGPYRAGRRRAALARFAAGVRADFEAMKGHDGKYDARGRPPTTSLPYALVERIGLQMLASYRLMRLARELGMPLTAKVLSRLIRHLYSAEIHWDAEIAPGAALSHGMGLGIGYGARIAEGVILSHNVSIGAGIDPVTRKVGTPTIETNVHIGPGAILLGPYTIGARSKIAAGAVVMQSIPPDSIVEAPPPRIRARAGRAPGPEATASPPAQASLPTGASAPS
ncbi:MAG: glycosyltransferase [Byssovorax sp.]